jgi:hypothetical protein
VAALTSPVLLLRGVRSGRACGVGGVWPASAFEASGSAYAGRPADRPSDRPTGYGRRGHAPADRPGGRPTGGPAAHRPTGRRGGLEAALDTALRCGDRMEAEAVGSRRPDGTGGNFMCFSIFASICELESLN